MRAGRTGWCLKCIRTLTLTLSHNEMWERGKEGALAQDERDCRCSDFAVELLTDHNLKPLSRPGRGEGPWRAALFSNAAYQNFDAWRQRQRQALRILTRRFAPTLRQAQGRLSPVWAR